MTDAKDEAKPSPNLLGEYKEVCNNVRTTDDISFKLLGFLPLFAGGGAFLLLFNAKDLDLQSLLLFCVIGFLLTSFLYMWERRNIQECNALIARAKILEYQLGLNQKLEPEDIFSKQERRALEKERIDPRELLKGQFRGRPDPLSILGLKLGKTSATYFIYFFSALIWFAPVMAHGRAEPVQPPPDTAAEIAQDMRQWPGPVEGTSVPGTVEIDPTSIKTLILVLIVFVVAIPVGIWWMLRKSVPKPVVVGVAALLSVGTLGLSGTLLKELNIGTLFKYEKLIIPEKLADVRVPVVAGYLGDVGPFLSGKDSIDDGSTKSKLTAIKNSWVSKTKQGRSGLILLIGSADRQRLGPRLRSRFGSNMGLARARAEWVRNQLVTKFIDDFESAKFLVLVSGPKRESATFPEDRSVEVRAIWGGTLEFAGQE